MPQSSTRETIVQAAVDNLTNQSTIKLVDAIQQGQAVIEKCTAESFEEWFSQPQVRADYTETFDIPALDDNGVVIKDKYIRKTRVNRRQAMQDYRYMNGGKI